MKYVLFVYLVASSPQPSKKEQLRVSGFTDKQWCETWSKGLAEGTQFFNPGDVWNGKEFAFECIEEK